MEIWSCYNGIWCAEMSDLEANDNPNLPGRLDRFDSRKAVVHRDNENDITHWTQTLEDGTVVEVFND